MAASVATVSVKDIRALIRALEPGTRRILHGVTWEEYQRLQAAPLNRPSVRTSFIEGILEITASYFLHETCNEFISALVRTAAEGLELSIEGAGSTTLRLAQTQTGVDPDKSFYIQHAKAMIGRDELNLEIDPPPDLVVEIDIISPSYSKQRIYAGFGVPEFWRYDGRQLEIWQLVDGQYRPSRTSVAFPLLQADTVASFIKQSSKSGHSAALCSFRSWLKEHKSQA